MRHLIGVSVITLLLGWTESSLATVRRDEGEAMFDFASRFEAAPQIGQPVTVHLMIVDFAGYPDDSIQVDAQLDVPAGWEVVSGETRHRIKTLVRQVGWTVTLRPTQAGSFELRRQVRIDRGRFGSDEGEFLQAVELRQDSTTVGTTRIVRLETVRDSQRYRYGDAFLVPIDAPEDFTQSDLSERVQVTSHRSATCSKCSSKDPQTVSWVVFVGPNGRVREARLNSNVDKASPAVASTRAALQGWAFSPAKVKGKSVTDWLVVHVQVAK